MAQKIASLFILGAVALSIAGCALPEFGQSEKQSVATPTVAKRQGPDETDDFASLVYLAAQTLGERAEILDKATPIVVTTMVSIDDLHQSSTFGRLASELVANRFAQRGYLVRDLRYMKDGITLQPETGALVLSWEASKLLESIKAQAVVAGTYAIAGNEIYLNLRLLGAKTGDLLSSVDAVIPLNDNTRPLVEGTTAFVPLDQYTGTQAGESADLSPLPGFTTPRVRTMVSRVTSHMLVP